MTNPKRQRTVDATIIDRETGYIYFTSLRIERRKIVLNPTPGLILPTVGVSDLSFGEPPFDRLEARALRLGQLMQRRWFAAD